MYAYNAANQLLSMSGASYAYDNNGNLVARTTSGGMTYYAWDYENRLAKVTLPDGSIVSFRYDPFGRRIEKTVNGQVTRYFYDNDDILFEYYSSSNIGNKYIHGPGIDEPLALLNAKGVYYYHADGLGSIVALTDTAERVVQDYEYNSFGHLKDQKNRIKQPYRFTGREWDRETGLYFYRARYYDPEVGRFITKDPIGLLGNVNLYDHSVGRILPKTNLYVYTDNNPIHRTDPSGEKWWIDVVVELFKIIHPPETCLDPGECILTSESDAGEFKRCSYRCSGDSMVIVLMPKDMQCAPTWNFNVIPYPYPKE